MLCRPPRYACALLGIGGWEKQKDKRAVLGEEDGNEEQ